MTFKPAAARLAAMLICFGLSTQAPAQGDDLQEAQKLLKQGQTDRAMERVDQYLKTKPKDARGRFLRGILLAEQNRPEDAIRAFTELTRDYPELPEPYNNLAVLYAAQGQYDRARGALEMAIRTHPSYATAHENLGDIYARMASQAYDKALQLDKGNKAAQTKLNLINDLFTAGRRPTVALAGTEPAPRPAAKKPVAPAAAAAPAPAASPPKPAPVAAREPVKAPAREPVKAAAPPAAAMEAVVKAVERWAAAWSGNDVSGYLAHYAGDFRTPDGASRKAWENERRARIAKPREIEVSIEAPRVTLQGDDNATVTFRQHYRSSNFKSSVNKTLVMIRSGKQWLIREENVGG